VIALRVLHLLGGAVLQLEADVVEQQQRDEREEDRAGRLEFLDREPVHAVVERVHDHRDREEAQHEHAQVGPGIRDPLAPPQRDDRHADRDPDEHELEQVVTEAPVADLVEVAAPRRGRREGQRAAHPKRVGHPIQDRADPGPEPSPRQLHPLVRPTLLREGSPQLRHQQGVREQEHRTQHDDPGERLCAVARHLAENVEADDRAHGEEHHVEMAQALDQLHLLLERERRGVLDRWHDLGHWSTSEQSGKHA